MSFTLSAAQMMELFLYGIFSITMRQIIAVVVPSNNSDTLDDSAVLANNTLLKCLFYHITLIMIYHRVTIPLALNKIILFLNLVSRILNWS